MKKHNRLPNIKNEKDAIRKYASKFDENLFWTLNLDQLMKREKKIFTIGDKSKQENEKK